MNVDSSSSSVRSSVLRDDQRKQRMGMGVIRRKGNVSSNSSSSNGRRGGAGFTQLRVQQRQQLEWLHFLSDESRNASNNSINVGGLVMNDEMYRGSANESSFDDIAMKDVNQTSGYNLQKELEGITYEEKEHSLSTKETGGLLFPTRYHLQEKNKRKISASAASSGMAYIDDDLMNQGKSPLSFPTTYHLKQKQRQLAFIHEETNTASCDLPSLNDKIPLHIDDNESVSYFPYWTLSSCASSPSLSSDGTSLPNSARGSVPDFDASVINNRGSITSEKSSCFDIATASMSPPDFTALSYAEDASVEVAASSDVVSVAPPLASSSTSSRSTAQLKAKSRRRKDSHNAVERRRRFNINDRILELGDVVPLASLPKGVKPTKGYILNNSVEYIRNMKSLNDKLVMQLQMTNAKCHELAMLKQQCVQDNLMFSKSD